MLQHLSIRNYALIENLKIDFFKGFTVITGETGSGKSVILRALNLILGNRIDNRSSINGEKCVVEVSFMIDEYKLISFFSENDLDFEPKNTILRREIYRNGKSRAFINDTPVKLDILKEFSSKLIDIHSQHNNIVLNKSNYQLQLIDKMAINQSSSHKHNIEYFEKKFKKLQYLNNSLIKARNAEIESKEMLDYHSYLLDELKEANLIDDEKSFLESSIKISENRENVLKTLSKISYILEENHQSPSVISQLEDLYRDIDKISKINKEYNDLSNRFSSILIELSDLVRESDELATNVGNQSINIHELNNRLNLINQLEQKHQTNRFEDLLNKKVELEKKVSSIISLDTIVKDIENEIISINSEIELLVKKISLEREKVLPIIQSYVETQIQKMGIKNGRFRIEMEHRKIINKLGGDDVKFLFSANKGVSLEEIDKVASGGETSRLMLSIKSLLNTHIKMPTLILDEIDAGVSGEIAGKMASVLQEMSKNSQLIVISHLPQIAAKANYHYRVQKIDENNKTKTKIYSLNENEKIEELTKMLSGEILSQAARENAKALRLNS